MPTTTGNTVTIGGFDFRRDTITDLSNFFSSNGFGFNDLINPVENRRGVYYFFDNEGSFSYIGCAPIQDIKTRIAQYRRESDRKGNSFYNAYRREHPESPEFEHFEQHVITLQLGTISTDLIFQNDERKNTWKATAKGIEAALICKYKPIHNKMCYRVTDSECRQLSRDWLIPNHACRNERTSGQEC